MNITTTARHYELAPALKDYAEEKITNLKRYFDHLVTAHLVFSLEKYRHRVEVSLRANGRDFVGVEETDDMYVSVDRVVEKLETQLRKHKDRLQRRKMQQSLSEAASEAFERGEAAETAEADEMGEADETVEN